MDEFDDEEQDDPADDEELDLDDTDDTFDGYRKLYDDEDEATEEWLPEPDVE